MDTGIHKITPHYKFDGGKFDYTVEIVYIEYNGGGEAWEFRILDTDGSQIHLSEVGGGNPLAMAASAYEWLQQIDRI